jgi:hypothetical protein
LGGIENKSYKDLQKVIDKMIQIGVDVDDNSQPSFYKELVRNVKHNNRKREENKTDDT